jgi:hypothetical protein
VASVGDSRAIMARQKAEPMIEKASIGDGSDIRNPNVLESIQIT